MARHRSGLKRLYDLKPKAHALCSLLTRGSPAMARALDFFPAYAPPPNVQMLHDTSIASPMAAPRYAEELARNQQFNREHPLTGAGVPPYPMIRRMLWEARDIYVPGRIIMPVDRGIGRIVSHERRGNTNWAVTRPRPFRKPPIEIAGRAMGFLYMKHYGHLLTDVLGPIALAVQQGLVTPENPVTMVVAARDNPVSVRFVEGMLRLGLARDVVRLTHEDSAICESWLQGEVLVASGEHKYGMPEATDTLRRIFMAADDAGAPPAVAHPKVYFQRGAVKLRQVAGEAALIEALRDRGWHIFESSWGNHAEQLAVFGGFQTMVGVHGAGLANLIFARPGARVVELQAGNARKTTGLFWAACAGLDYVSAYGGPEGADQSFTIDPAEVLALLDRLDA